MEKRILLAIVLSFLVLVLYQALFFKKKPLPETQPEETAKIEKSPQFETYRKESLPQAGVPQETQKKQEQSKVQTVSAQAEENILIETSLYQAVWSNKGGVLKSWKLKKHADDEGEDLELVSRRSSELQIYGLSLRTEDPDFDNTINNALYKSSNLKLELKEGQRGELRFQYANVSGTKVEKVFTFQSGTYDFSLLINVWKNGQKIEPRLLWGPGFGNLSPLEQKKRFGRESGLAVFASGKVIHEAEKKVKPESNVFNFTQWAAYENNYFAALFITSPQVASAAFLKEGPENTPYFFLSLSLPQKVYIGPKDIDTLTLFGHEAKRLINFGLFGFIAEILLRASKFFFKLIPNWGVTIIILTFVIKILFFPLTYSSMRSMAKIQEIQPKIKALRAKYKKAKQDIAQRRRMNEEIMALYKEYGVNPAGGCLPMLIQLPIFWGFFRLLVVSIEFRHSPFVLWIKDLSAQDPYYVTPILMGVTQYISQKMTPTSADPTQARMMLIMPVVMTFFFMSFQSGLVLYWLTTNVLQIGQQYIINRLNQKKKRELHGKRRNK
jgi:YidC/Oxa1 family membrane protein insertase